MSWARSLPVPVRRVVAALVRGASGWLADAGAIGPDDALARRFGRFGRGSCIAFPQGAIFNERHIHVGRDTLIGPHACLTAGMAPGQEMLFDTVVRIGDRCVIGRGAHVVGHWSIEIGDDIQTGPYVYITDQNHSYEDPVAPVGRQWPVEQRVRIGSGSWLGAHAVVLPGTTIGEHVVVAAGAVVRGEIPDRCVVAGVPARIVRRWLPGRGWVDWRGADGADQLDAVHEADRLERLDGPGLNGPATNGPATNGPAVAAGAAEAPGAAVPGATGSPLS